MALDSVLSEAYHICALEEKKGRKLLANISALSSMRIKMLLQIALFMFEFLFALNMQ